MAETKIILHFIEKEMALINVLKNVLKIRENLEPHLSQI
jgi:hypothetical protein